MRISIHRHLSAVLSLVTLILIWSYSWIVMKQVTQYIGAFDFTALRCISGAFILFMIQLLRCHSLRPTPFFFTLAIALFQSCGMVGLAQWALMSGGAGQTALLSYTMPFWVIIITALLYKDRIGRLRGIAVLAAFAGLTFILKPWDLSSTKGILPAISSGISWAISTLTTKRMFARYPATDLITLTAWQMVYAAIIMSIIVLLIPQGPINWQPPVIFALGYSAIFATALAWCLWLFILRSLPISTAGLTTLGVPVCGIFFSWLFLDEIPGKPECIGMSLVILSLVILSISPVRKSVASD